MKATQTEAASDARAPVKDWRKPVLTVIRANGAENGPGATPDAGVDFS